MNEARAKVLSEVLEWSPQERGELAVRLIESLESSPDEGVAAAWISEVQRRAAEIDSGEATLLPWEEVRRSLRGEHGTMAD